MRLLSGSVWRKLLATAVAAGAFVLVYEAIVIDSRLKLPGGAAVTRGPLMAGAQLKVVATAYCKGDVTASGVAPQTGIAAADPDLLPEGSVIQLDGVPEKQRGIWTVMDTGPRSRAATSTSTSGAASRPSNSAIATRR